VQERLDRLVDSASVLPCSTSKADVLEPRETPATRPMLPSGGQIASEP
jgi:hypothetical protein